MLPVASSLARQAGPKAVILGLHGFGVTAMPGRSLAVLGRRAASAYSYDDQRGFGKGLPLRPLAPMDEPWSMTPRRCGCCAQYPACRSILPAKKPQAAPLPWSRRTGLSSRPG